jgi:cellulose synthase/poly-beta-1,6-N-acetylglucosamine synthase-like glycosyltransferase
MLGIFLEWLREKKALRTAGGEQPSVSIIIPVHNESQRIEGLLKSLDAENYTCAEYIFIDDRSDDNSAELINEFIQRQVRKSALSCKARIITLTENPGPNYKQYALTQGIEAASGDFLFFTDADCIVPPQWIEGMVRRFSDEKVGAVIGPVFKSSGGKGFFHMYQCYEHGVRYIYLAGATGLGAAGGGFGNNLALRRACLDAVGGYKMIPPSPTEDAALISRIRACTDYKIRSAIGEDVHIMTQSESTWKAFIGQTLRWNNGGLFSPDLSTRLNYNFLMITISMGVLAFPLLPFIPSIWLLPLGPVTVMIFNTIANLSLFGASLPRQRFCFAYLLTLLFTPIYFTLMTVLGFLGFKPKWKGKQV